MQDGKSILFSDLLHIYARRRIGNSGTGGECMELGIASVAAITAVSYLIGMAVKAPGVADKWIPIIIICGAAGLVLGVVAWTVGVKDFPAHDWLNAAAVGIASGWAATGLNQSVKQLTKQK